MRPERTADGDWRLVVSHHPGENQSEERAVTSPGSIGHAYAAGCSKSAVIGTLMLDATFGGCRSARTSRSARSAQEPAERTHPRSQIEAIQLQVSSFLH